MAGVCPLERTTTTAGRIVIAKSRRLRLFLGIAMSVSLSYSVKMKTDARITTTRRKLFAGVSRNETGRDDMYGLADRWIK